MEKRFLCTSKEGLVIANRGLIETGWETSLPLMEDDAREAHAGRGMSFLS